MSERTKTQVMRYGVAVFAVLVAVAVRLAFEPVLGERAPYWSFLVALLVVAWRAGFGPGCAVTVLGTVAAVVLDAAAYGVSYLSGHTVLGMGIFLCIGVFSSAMIASLREGQARAQQKILAASREQEALEAARKAGEHRFSQFMQHLTGLAWIKDLQGRYLYVNEGAAIAFRLPAEQIYGKTDEEIFSAETAAQFRANDRRALDGTATQSIELLKQADGIVHHSIVNKFPIMGPDGKIAMVGGMAIDITDRRKIEDELRQSEERLRIALEAGRMGTWHWDIPANRVFWSPALETIHGLEPGTFSGTFDAYQSDMHPDDRERVLASIQATLAGGQDHRVDYRIVWPDGSIHWVEARGRLLYDATKTPIRMVGVCADITERKQSEATLRFLADASKSLALVVDLRSTLKKVAQLAVPHFADWCVVDIAGADGGLERLAVAHADPNRLRLAEELTRRYLPDPGSATGATAAFRTGESQLTPRITPEMLASAVRDDKHREMLEELGLLSYMCVPLKTHGRVLGAISFVSAESGRVYSEDDLALAEDLAYRATIAIENARLYSELKDADRRKDDFLATLAHELRNPLVPIRSGLDLLAMQGAGERATIELMQQQLEHLVRLVDDLLDVSRIIRGKVELRKEPVGLTTILNRAVEAIRWTIDKEEQHLVVVTPKEPISLYADPVRLVQIVENLLSNASKYTDCGGRIELESELQDSQAVIRVRDNGTGIDADLLPKVFDLFTQSTRSLDRSHGGLGIGLTLVRNLVEMHGGSVSAVSEGPSRGSEFTVRLPVATEMCAIAPKPSFPSPAAARRILVVDDNLAAAKLLSQLLATLGDHQIELAHDGESALRKAAEFLPDLILLDIGLPGMNGYLVANTIRANPILSKVVLAALTGYGQEADRRRSLEAGFDEHLVKPPALADIARLLVHPKLASGRDGSGDPGRD